VPSYAAANNDGLEIDSITELEHRATCAADAPTSVYANLDR